MAPLEELAQKTADGDKDAFAEIYGTLLDPVYRYLYWNVGSREDAEDIAEEVFLKCLMNIGGYDPKRGPFKAWAFRIAHNLMVDHQRRRGSRPGLRHRLSRIGRIPRRRFLFLVVQYNNGNLTGLYVTHLAGFQLHEPVRHIPGLALFQRAGT